MNVANGSHAHHVRQSPMRAWGLTGVSFFPQSGKMSIGPLNCGLLSSMLTAALSEAVALAPSELDGVVEKGWVSPPGV
jgi:hypothetical protein